MNIAKTVKRKLAQMKAGFKAGRRDRAQGGGLTGLFLGILVAGIVGILVFIPVWNDAVASANLSGNTATIADQVPLFAVLILLVALASPLMQRVR